VPPHISKPNQSERLFASPTGRLPRSAIGTALRRGSKPQAELDRFFAAKAEY